MSNDLMSGLFIEMDRVRDLITEYKRIPNGAGLIGAGLMTVDIKMAEKLLKKIML